MENLDTRSVVDNQLGELSTTNETFREVREETPIARKKRVLNHRLANAHRYTRLLVKTFDQPGYDYQESDLIVVEGLLNDMLSDLQCTKAAKALRGQARNYQV